MRLIARLRCWWRGHEGRFVFTREALQLHCEKCGTVTKGWTLEPRFERHPTTKATVIQTSKSRVWWLHAVHEKRGA